MDKHLRNSNDVLQVLIDLDILKPGQIQDWQLRIIINELLKYVGISENEIGEYLGTLFAQ